MPASPPSARTTLAPARSTHPVLPREEPEAIVPLTTDPYVQDALRCAVGAIGLLEPQAAQGLLDLSSKRLGHLLKQALREAIALESHALARRPATDPNPGMACPPWDESVTTVLAGESLERQRLLRKGELVPQAAVRNAWGVGRSTFAKALASGRVFTVEVNGHALVPVFFAQPNRWDRKDLGKVARRLGDRPGWSKYGFFTTANVLLDHRTPLEALADGDLDAVVRTAYVFAGR